MENDKCKGCGVFIKSVGCGVKDSKYKSKCPCRDCLVKVICSVRCNDRRDLSVDFLLSEADERESILKYEV